MFQQLVNPMAYFGIHYIPVLPEFLGVSGGTSLHVGSRERLVFFRQSCRMNHGGARRDYMEKMSALSPTESESSFIREELGDQLRFRLMPLVDRRKRLALER